MKKVITERDILELEMQGIKVLIKSKDTIITTLAFDRIHSSKFTIVQKEIPQSEITHSSDTGNSISGKRIITQIHFWYGYDYNLIPKNKSGNPVPGKFPYKFSFDVPQDNFSFYVPYPEGWVCGTSFSVAAHSVCGPETGWGVGSPIVAGNGNWGMYYQATPECPITDDDGDGCESYQTETAFGGNNAGAGNSWWYYYDASIGGVQEMYAGQTIDVGSVEVSGGNVTITLEDGWELSPVSEPVKIQGYETLPAKRPAAGLFTTYKGNSWLVASPLVAMLSLCWPMTTFSS